MQRDLNEKMVSLSQFDRHLTAIADELDVPASRYEAAERAYASVGNWLDRPDSSIRKLHPKVYPQGSFALGTAIRPISEEENYDVDLVCQLVGTKTEWTQMALKEAVARELHAYAKAHSMAEPTEKRRCVTLNYADGAQFHLDSLPSLSDGADQRRLIEAAGLATDFSGTAIAITDFEHPNYRRISPSWPASNPLGYATWFRGVMKTVFDARRQQLALAARASVEQIPEYRVKVPLQRVVQLLKRHRDIYFQKRSDEKPISIIITTLAARAYANEVNIGDALERIIAGLDHYIQVRNGVYWIPNPSDPRENFADRWSSEPGRKEAFYEWLAAVRADFSVAFRHTNVADNAEHLKQILGSRAATAALASTPPIKIPGAVQRLMMPAHKRQPPWRYTPTAHVEIDQALARTDGFRSHVFTSNGRPLPKGTDLTFRAQTDVPAPFTVYWQIVNSGVEAERAGDLRGDFTVGTVYSGGSTHKEATRYSGSHTIECFIVKDGLLVARSGEFVVNIQ